LLGAETDVQCRRAQVKIVLEGVCVVDLHRFIATSLAMPVCGFVRSTLTSPHGTLRDRVACIDAAEHVALSASGRQSVSCDLQLRHGQQFRTSSHDDRQLCFIDQQATIRHYTIVAMPAEMWSAESMTSAAKGKAPNLAWCQDSQYLKSYR
jgi:hypothetical protein